MENAEEADSDAELTLLNQSTDSLNLSISSADGRQALSECSAELELRPKLILNIMSGPNHENSVVMGHEEIETGEEHDKFHDVPNSVILRHPRVPPLHGQDDSYLRYQFKLLMLIKQTVLNFCMHFSFYLPMKISSVAA